MAKRNPPPNLDPGKPRLLDAQVARQALDLFLFSCAFAILFNLTYVEGIELKVAPKTGGKNKDPKTATAAPTYPGLKATPSGTGTRTAPLPTPDPLGDLPRVSLLGAKERFDSGAAVFLDARPEAEYKEAHIPGALHFYGEEFDKYAPLVLPKLTDKDREIICYCHGVSCELSVHLAKKLMEQGYRRVKVFFGGWPEWKKAGYPTTPGERP
jgi:rhodanese-related sulfurtransferase